MDYFNIAAFLLVGLLSTILVTSADSPPLLLTPFIKENKTTEARHQSLVNATVFLNVTSHSGFLTVDETYNSNMFFWYFPVANKTVEKTPWIIWLQSGSGASSLAGLFDEVGPFKYENNSLKPRMWSWNKEYSMLFMDNPIGTGFSFTNDERGYATNMSKNSDHLYTAVQQFLTIFPELRSAPLYMAGESFASRHVPVLAEAIAHRSVFNSTQSINFQGIILGNPVLNFEDVNNLTEVFLNWGLIDKQRVQSLKAKQDNFTHALIAGNDRLASKMRNELLDEINNVQNGVLNDSYKLGGFEEYIKREEVRKALHLGNAGLTSDNATDRIIPNLPAQIQSKIEALLENHKVLIYCGQLDLLTPCVTNAAARQKNWNWSKREDFLGNPRTLWWHNGSIAGYVKSGGGFTEALVRSARYLVPIDKPAQAFELISHFIGNVELPLPPNFQIKYECSSKEDSGQIPDHPKVIPLGGNNSSTMSSEGSTSRIGIIISLIINFLLGTVLIVGVFLYYRLKKKTQDFFYSNVDTNSDDIFLT